ncbi:toll/interleukin-1 receptor domain-containing protein [Amycolatopsis keratiniphila]|uniref:toll/interleukin-1 receptor domain-containing protein n=1 Tax=Amycolatopsis keratiniphila TaxID=129921 RepID=UPI0033CD2AF4
MRRASSLIKIFLNYRTADDRFGVALLDHELSRAFGPETVFFASKSIELGADWEKSMFDAVAESEAVLVVMGRHWLGDVDEAGLRRIDDPQDFVRREILLAFELGKRVIPVRLDVPDRVRADDLPEELRPLSELQDIAIGFRSASPDIDRLAARLRELIPGLRAQPAPKSASAGKFTAYAHEGGVVSQYDQVTVNGDFHAGPRFG